jgi:hypothetical protein
MVERYGGNGVKASATTCGLDRAVFSAHLCRIGGATAMCAAGYSRTKIQQRGGWSELSDSDLIYAISLPSDSEGNREVTIDDIRWLQGLHLYIRSLVRTCKNLQYLLVHVLSQFTQVFESATWGRYTPFGGSAL